MQSTDVDSVGVGLHERKTHQTAEVNGQNDNHGTREESPEESEKDKKTFGRTPDGVGKHFLATLSLLNALYLVKS